MSGRIRVLIADDHPLFREGLRASLASNPETELVGEAEDGVQAIEAALQLKPDVVLMDIQMPLCDGVTATRRILEKEPAIRVLVLTMHEDDESVLSGIRAGARGYVVKGDTADAVLRAIVAVAHGEVLIGAGIADRMAALLNGSPGPVSHTAFPDLTDREREALRLIGRGMRNAEIATQMHVTEKTVRNYVTRIFAKLMVSSRVEAVIRAREGGL